MSRPTVGFSLNLTPEECEHFDRVAQKMGLSVQAMVREAVRQADEAWPPEAPTNPAIPRRMTPAPFKAVTEALAEGREAAGLPPPSKPPKAQ